MAKRRKKPLLARLKKQADKALSEYVRAVTLRTFGKCPICSNGPIECCFHFISRKRQILRWDIRNVVGACHRCNFMERYFLSDISRAWLVRNWGANLYLDLVADAIKPFKPTVPYLEGIIATYEKKLEELKEENSGHTDAPQDPPSRPD